MLYSTRKAKWVNYARRTSTVPYQRIKQRKYCIWSHHLCAKHYHTSKLIISICIILINVYLVAYIRSVTSVQVEKDAEDDVAYVSMDDPTASEISFVRSECPTKQVLKVSCANLECGVQVTHEAGANPVLAKMSAHGDWPWHMALFKDDVHICDGTLVSPNWVVTTTSCFQGQPKAEWLVRAGSVRLSSSSPWQQERRIVGMVKSPVEGSTIAMVKLEEPLMMTDFVRPVCLPQQLQASDALHCNTLGWARNRDQLQRVEIKVTVMEKCENISISSVNSLCTETAYGQEDCSVSKRHL